MAHTEVFPWIFFGTVRQKFSDRKTWYHRKIRKAQSGSRTFFLVLWDKKLRQNCYAFQVRVAPPPVSHLCMEIFHTVKFSKHNSLPLKTLLVMWDKQKSTENSDIPFLCIELFDTSTFLKHPSVPQQSFSLLWDKRLRQSRCLHCPKNFSIPELFWNTSAPLRFFLVPWDINFCRTIAIPHTPSPLLAIFAFNPKVFPKHRMASPRKFSWVWDKFLGRKYSAQNIEFSDRIFY